MTVPDIITRQRYKVVVLGAPAAGKTALVRRLADGSFVEGARQRGLDFYTCHITLREDVSITLQLWDLSDCPCQTEDDHVPLSTYIFNSQAVLFVYDVSCPASLEALRYALYAVEAVSSAAGGTRPYLALVATKCDLKWTAPEALAHELAARHGCVRFILSSRSGQGVTRAAAQLACDLAGVPLSAATEQLANLQDGPTVGLSSLSMPTFDDRAPTAAVPLNGPAPEAADATSIAVDGAAKLVGASQRKAPAEPSFRFRAPAYQAAARTPPSPLFHEPFSAGIFNDVPMYGMGSGDFGDAPAWRPVSRSTTSSQTATLISRTGPLGQRLRSDSPTLVPPSDSQSKASTAQAAIPATANSLQLEDPAAGAQAARSQQTAQTDVTSAAASVEAPCAGLRHVPLSGWGLVIHGCFCCLRTRSR